MLVYTVGMFFLLDPYTLPGVLTWALLALGTTLRLSRLITSDKLGLWFRGRLERLVQPAEDAKRAGIAEVLKTTGEGGLETFTPEAIRYLSLITEQLNDPEPITVRGRLVAALGCPYCIGFWIGLAVTFVTVSVAYLSIIGAWWAFACIVFTLNYIVGHLASRID